MTRFRFGRMFGLATIFLTMAGTQQARANQYSIDYIIDPYHTGVGDSWFLDINNQGQATGYMLQPRAGGGFTRDAVIYRNGETQTLATATSFEGNLGTAGLAINSFGDVVGQVDGQPTFFPSGATAVPIEVPAYSPSLYVVGLVPGGVNDSGNVLLGVYPNDPADTPPGAFAGLAIWSVGGAKTLSALDELYPYVNPPDPNDFNSGPSSSAGTASVTHLNNANHFAASVHQFDFDPMDPDDFDDDVFTESFAHAYIYDGQSGYRILQPATPGEKVRPIDIDEAGIVFGWTGNQLALWGPNGDLQSLLPDSGEVLDDVGGYGFPSAQRNELGQVVALTSDGGVLLFDPVLNHWSNITSLIDGLGTGSVSSIQGFNDLGQFVGLARPPQGGGVFGYVASPVPEPASLTLLLTGSAALVLLQSVRRKFKNTLNW